MPLQNEAERADQDEQQREDREESVVRDRRREIAALVIGVLLPDRERKAQPAVALLEAIEPVVAHSEPRHAYIILFPMVELDQGCKSGLERSPPENGTHTVPRGQVFVSRA